MKKLKRPKSPPSSLLTDRVISAKREIAEFLRQNESSSIQRRLPLQPELWEQKDTVDILRQMSDGRCFVCESQMTAPRHPVHHYRPTSNAGSLNGPESYTHYSWLAYEWENLLYVCGDCQRSAGVIFPVAGSRSRVSAPLLRIIAQEKPLLLDPCRDEPRRHIEFSLSGHAHHKSQRGLTTIFLFGLNRQSLVTDRRRAFRRFISLLNGYNPKLKNPDRNIAERVGDLFNRSPSHPGALESFVRSVFADAFSANKMKFPASAEGFLRDFPALFSRLSPNDIKNSVAQAMTKRGKPPARKEVISLIGKGKQKPESRKKRQSDRTAFSTKYSVSTVQHVEIASFGGIPRLQFSIPENRDGSEVAACLMILGENSTCKSTILQAIALALIGPRAAIKLVDDAEKYLRRKNPDNWALVNPEPAEVRVSVYGGAAGAFSIEPGTSSIKGSGSGTTLVLGYGTRRYFSGERKKPSHTAHQRVATLFSPEATIAHPRPWLASLDKEQFSAVARGLREILALSADDELVHHSEHGMCIRTFNQLIPIGRMSEGYKSIFAMSVDIMRSLLRIWGNLERARAVVLIDEIETHLHPRWKMQVMGALRRAMPQVQFIVTTHDPLCLRGLDDGEVQVLHRDKLQNVGFLEDLPSIRGMRADQILTSDYFGLSSTVDPEIEHAIAQYADLLSIPDEKRSPIQRESALELQKKIAGTLKLGSSTAEQIAQEAISIYLAERRNLPAADRTDARKRVVSDILAALRKTEVQG